MEEVTENEKRTLKTKFYEFRKSGLVSYINYLNEQLEYASKTELRKAYKNYVEDQIVMANKKIKELEEKLR